MGIIKEGALSSEDKKVVFDLWNNEYPVNLGFGTISDMDNYLDTLPNLLYYLLKNDKQQIEGWAMTFSAEGEKWFAITISKNNQKHGKGTALLNTLKNDNESLNGWVIDHENVLKKNGQIYQSPLRFYEKSDFRVFPEIRLELPILSAVKIRWSKKDGSLY